MGLSDGLSGIMIFLYNYAHKYNNEDVQSLADDIIGHIWNNLFNFTHNYSPNFFTGSSGVGWAIEYIHQKKF